MTSAGDPCLLRVHIISFQLHPQLQQRVTADGGGEGKLADGSGYRMNQCSAQLSILPTQTTLFDRLAVNLSLTIVSNAARVFSPVYLLLQSYECTNRLDLPALACTHVTNLRKSMTYEPSSS